MIYGYDSPYINENDFHEEDENDQEDDDDDDEEERYSETQHTTTFPGFFPTPAKPKAQTRT
jgi:hypothetical protein